MLYLTEHVFDLASDIRPNWLKPIGTYINNLDPKSSKLKEWTDKFGFEEPSFSRIRNLPNDKRTLEYIREKLDEC